MQTPRNWKVGELGSSRHTAAGRGTGRRLTESYANQNFQTGAKRAREHQAGIGRGGSGLREGSRKLLGQVGALP